MLLVLLFCCAGIELANAQQNPDPIRVYHELNSDDSYTFFADNTAIITAFTRVSFPSLVNLTASVPLPLEIALAAQTTRYELFSLVPGSGRRTSFSLEYFTVLGNPLSLVLDNDYAYLIPIEHGKKFRVDQAFNGRFSHFGQNQYAVDFTMPEGTPIHAARGGLVIEVKEDSKIGGPGPQFNDYGNFIRIYHSDGTFGNYVHLQFDGALVNVGAEIEAGDLIGLSGNTGRSSGPHLHFDVRVPTVSGTMQSIPLKFLNYDGKIVSPEAGKYFYGYVPGMPTFKAIFGANLVNSDFESYIADAPTAKGPDIRYELVDDAYVVFIANGTERGIDVEVNFTLTNLDSSRGKTVKMRIRPRTELFLTLLKPTKSEESTGFRTSIKYVFY